MDTQEVTSSPKLEVPHRRPVQKEQKAVLGKVSDVKLSEKKNTYPFRKDETVFLLGFVKAHKGKHFVCKGIVTQLPEKGKRPVYKVRITAVADSPIGGTFVVEQAVLLNKTITKHADELHRHLNPFMAPPNWIELAPHS